MPQHVKQNVLTEICSFINAEMPYEQQIKAVVEAASKVIGSEKSALIILDEQTHLLHYHLVLEEQEHELKTLSVKLGGIAGWVIEHGEPLNVPDVSADSRYSPKIREKLHIDLRSLLCVPIRINGRVVGALEALNPLEARSFTEEDLPLVTDFAALVGTVLRNAQSRLSVDQQNTELEDLVRSKNQQVAVAQKNLTITTQRLALTTKMISLINSNRLMSDILVQVAEQMRRLIPFEYLTVATIQDDKKSIKLQEVYPSPGNPTSDMVKIPLDDPVVAYAVKYKRSLFHNRPRWYHCFLEEGRFLQEPLNTMFCTPIMTADATMLGTLNMGNREERTYSKDAMNIITFIAKQLGVAFERHTMQHTLERLNKELNDKTFELRKNIITMGDANLKLFEAQQQLREKDKKMQALLEEVQTKNEELQTTLEELKQTQSQLVQSEKMASLGQIVAGIAHEINTPAGAIKAASEILPEYIQKTFRMYEDLLEAGITPEHRQHIHALLDVLVNMAKERERKTTSEMRQQGKDIQARLSHLNIEGSRKLARDIARCYLENQIDVLLELFTYYSPERVMNFLNYCSRVMVSARDNQISVSTISKIIHALKSYSYQDKSLERKVDLNEDLENTLTILHSQIPDTISIVKHFGDLPPLSCLGSELNQCWTNIIQNALQALEETGGVITINTFATSQQVVISISDTGPGIPEEIQDKIFDPFFTTRRGKASGLGLSIAYKVIEKHRGHIGVQSEPGKTTFEVKLPVEGIDFKQQHMEHEGTEKIFHSEDPS